MKFVLILLFIFMLGSLLNFNV